MARITNAIEAIYGAEPTVTSINPASPTFQHDILNALNWYRTVCDKSNAKEYVINYMQDHGYDAAAIRNVKRLRDSQINTSFGWLSRIISRGATIPQDKIDGLHVYLDTFVTAEIVEEVKPKVVDVQAALNSRIGEFIGEVEGAWDDHMSGKTLDMAQLLKTAQIGSPYARRLLDWLDHQRATLEAALVDSDLREGYSNYSLPQLKRFIKDLTKFREEVEKYADIKKANRKPRKRKVIPASKQVAKLFFLLQHENLASINPVEIIGAEELWVYNVAYKKLGVYYALDAKGFGCKGSTLTNFDEARSTQRVLRHPEDVIPLTLEGGKIVRNKLLPSLTTKPQTMTGRINKDTILLRVIR